MAAHELIDLRQAIPGLHFDIRYASVNNFTGTTIYRSAQAFLQRPVADSLLLVQQQLSASELGLLIFDAYRPWHVSRDFWDRYPQYRNFLADPTEGSRHNRGCAIDLSLCRLADGVPLPMPCDYDDFSAAAWPTYIGGGEEQRTNRDLLRRVMESAGFVVHPHEWWHFDHPLWPEYAVLDLDFSMLD